MKIHTSIPRPRRRIAPVGAALLAGSFVFGVVLQANASDEVEPSTALIEAVPVLGEDQAAADTLPGFLLDGPQALPGIQPNSSRSLGTEDGIRMWTAVNVDGEGCLISLLPGPDEISTLTCSDVEAINDGLLTLASTDGDEGIRMTLLPAGYEAEATSLETEGEQLLIGDPGVATPSIGASDAVGDSIEVPAFPGIGQ